MTVSEPVMERREPDTSSTTPAPRPRLSRVVALPIGAIIVALLYSAATSFSSGAAFDAVSPGRSFTIAINGHPSPIVLGAIAAVAIAGALVAATSASRRRGENRALGALGVVVALAIVGGAGASALIASLDLPSLADGARPWWLPLVVDVRVSR